MEVADEDDRIFQTDKKRLMDQLFQEVQDGTFDIDSIMTAQPVKINMNHGVNEVEVDGIEGRLSSTTASNKLRLGKYKSRRNNPSSYTTMKTWSIIAQGAKTFKMPSFEGVKWKDVTRRVTRSF